MLQTSDDVLSFPAVLAWLRARWPKIALGGLACLLIALPFAYFRARTYEASTTLLVFPPTFKAGADASPARDADARNIADLMPRTLPMELYRSLALSPPVLAEVAEKAQLEAGAQALRMRLDVELLERSSRTPRDAQYAQALTFHARARDPQRAARIVNVWAQVFKDHMDALSAREVGETFALLESLHGRVKEELEEADRLLAEHQKAWRLELIKQQLEERQKQYTRLEGQLRDSEVSLATNRQRLAALGGELEGEPEMTVFFRAPSDDAYWLLQSEADVAPAPELGLRTERSNPNYVELRQAVTQLRADIAGLEARRAAVGQSIEEMATELSALSATYHDQNMVRTILARDVASLRASYDMVRTEYEKGRIADRTQASDIAITGDAVAPERPIGAGTLRPLLAALAAGMLATAGLFAAKDLSEMAVSATAPTAAPPPDLPKTGEKREALQESTRN